MLKVKSVKKGCEGKDVIVWCNLISIRQKSMQCEPLQFTVRFESLL